MMSTTLTKTLLLLLALLAGPGPGATGSDPSGCIDVEISGIEETGGELFVGLFSKPDGFPEWGNEYKGIVISVGEARELTCRFEDIPPGRYAIAIFHDTNLNGKLDKNFFSFPVEGVGLSRNIRRPDFEKAGFDFQGQHTSSIVLRY